MTQTKLRKEQLNPYSLLTMSAFLNLNPITASLQYPNTISISGTWELLQVNFTIFTIVAHDATNYYEFALIHRDVGTIGSDVTIFTINTKLMTTANWATDFEVTSFAQSTFSNGGYFWIQSTKFASAPDSYFIAPTLKVVQT